MSEYLGPVACPECGGLIWTAEDWETYVSLVCTACGHKLGELKEDEELCATR